MVDQKTPLLQQQQKPPVSRPKYMRRRSSFDPTTYNSTGQALPYVNSSHLDTDNPELTLLQLLGLTVCMAGVQFTWTVELSYGTPYLLSLDLPKEMTALVWLAGPLSGLIVQPLIGAMSDKCTSRFGKRRPYIVFSGVLTILSMVGVAYAKETGSLLARLMGVTTEHTWAIVVAVTAFYFLDFTLNAVQAICRALILDVPPLSQQELANAWSARMSNSAQVIGYFVGFIDLVKIAPWLGDSQIKGFCVVGIIVFCITLAITCLTVHEKPLERDCQENEPWYDTFLYIWRAFRYLPRPIQTLCNTQFFAWMGWFPFLFYSTQWVSDIYFATHPPMAGQDDNDEDWTSGTRAGSFALLCYSIVSVIAGIVLPAIVSRCQQRIGWLSIKSVYTLSHVVVAGALLSTWFVHSVEAATLILTIMGIPWAIVLWIPFSLVGEYVSHEDEQRRRDSSLQQETELHSSASSPSTLEHHPVDDFDAGMILGVHNMYIVFPQFAVAIIAALIFAALDSSSGRNDPAAGVASVLTFGGLMALVAAGFSRFITRVK